jgi:hypothetical protein
MGKNADILFSKIAHHLNDHFKNSYFLFYNYLSARTKLNTRHNLSRRESMFIENQFVILLQSRRDFMFSYAFFT